MLSQPLSAPRQRGRYALATLLVAGLALGYAGARAQTAPLPAPAQQPMPKNVTYYLDGNVVSQTDFANVKPDDIQSINVVKSAADRQKLGLSQKSAGALLVTTRANANAPAVVAFNSRFPVQPAAPQSTDAANLPSAYNSESAQVNAVVPKALAYITSHYPDARLSGEVTKLTQKSSGAVKYQVQLVQGRRPFSVYFSPEGDFLGE